MADFWQDLGYAREGISGPVPFEWSEVEAFNRLTGHELTPCEAHCLVDMSRAYCVEITNTNPLRIAPMERNL